jgi:Uma2 family endonuclease
MIEEQNPVALERAPEICIEVLSPSNTAGEMAEKCAIYFEAGAQEVWLCGLDGKIVFYTPEPSAQSAFCSEFPGQV